MPHRRRWAAAVRRACDAPALSAAAVQLVAALRRTALPGDWDLLPGEPQNGLLHRLPHMQS